MPIPGGHKYAGNAIIFAARDRQSRGDWFGYVKPDRVRTILRYTLEGESDLKSDPVIQGTWRGCVDCEDIEDLARST